MIISGSIYREHAINITPELLNEICDKIQQYYDKSISFHIILLDGDIIQYDTLDDLLKYTNAKTHRIERLAIFAKDIEYNSIELYFTNKRRHKTSYTVEVNYKSKCKENVNDFKNCFDLIFDRMYISKSYNFFADTLGLILTVIVLAFILVNIIYFKEIFDGDKLPFISMFIFFILCSVGEIRYFFPIIMFNWGDMSSYYERLDKIRENIIWTIIIPMISLPYLFNLVVNYLKSLF